MHKHIRFNAQQSPAYSYETTLYPMLQALPRKALECISLQTAAPFVVVNKASHCDAITALDAQRLGTLMVTAGNDHTVRVFDAATSQSVASFTVMDDISAVAVHPCSNLVLVATHAAVLVLEVTLYAAHRIVLPCCCLFPPKMCTEKIFSTMEKYRW